MSEQAADKIEILERGDRGFHGYGPPFEDTYGTRLEVYESSSAEGPHVWLKVDSSAWVSRERARGDEFAIGTAHLSEPQARALVARLMVWLNEIPSRWEGR